MKIASHVRPHFEGIDDLIWFNSCSLAPPLKAMREKDREYGEIRENGGAPRIGEALDQVAETKRLFADLIGCGDVGQIGLVPDASSGLSRFVTALALADNGRRLRNHNIVLVPAWTSNVNVLRHLCKVMDGAFELRECKVSGFRVDEGEVLARVDRDTVAVVVDSASAMTGDTLDLCSLGTGLRHAQPQCLLYVDAYQCLGVRPVDVVAAQIDVLVSGTCKYLYGEEGAGFVYLGPRFSAPFPTVGWSGLATPYSVTEDTVPSEGATRIQLGFPSVHAYMRALPGLKLVADVGVSAIREHILALGSRLVEGAAPRGLRVVSPLRSDRAASIYLVDVGQHDADLLALDLASGCRGTRVSVDTRRVDGRTYLRLGFGAFNTVEEVDCFLEAVVARE